MIFLYLFLTILLLFVFVLIFYFYFFYNEKTDILEIENFDSVITIDLNNSLLIVFNEKKEISKFDFQAFFENIIVIKSNDNFYDFMKEISLKNSLSKSDYSNIKNKITKFIDKEYLFLSRNVFGKFGYFGKLKPVKYNPKKSQITIVVNGYQTHNNNLQNYLIKTEAYNTNIFKDFEIFNNFHNEVKSRRIDYNLSIIKQSNVLNDDKIYQNFLLWAFKSFYEKYEKNSLYFDDEGNIYFLSKAIKTKNELLIHKYYSQRLNFIKFQFNKKMQIDFDFSSFEIASTKIVKNNEEMFDFAYCQIQQIFNNSEKNLFINFQKIIKFSEQVIGYSYSREDGINIEIKDDYFANREVVLISFNFSNQNIEDINNYTIFKKYEMISNFLKIVQLNINNKNIKDYFLLISLSTFATIENYYDLKKLLNYNFILYNSYKYLNKYGNKIKNISWKDYEIYLLQDNFWFNLETIILINPKFIFVTKNYLDKFENQKVDFEDKNSNYLNIVDIQNNYKDIKIKKL